MLALKMTEPITVSKTDTQNRIDAMKWWNDISLGFKQDLETQYRISFPDYPNLPLTGRAIEYLYNNYRA